MSGKIMSTSTNPISKDQLPSFVEMLDVSQKNIIEGLWNMNHLSISDKINSIDSILKEMPLEAKKEYRKWRFLMDRSKMPDFYDSQNDHIKDIISAMFEKYTDLEEFAQRINSIKPMLNNPDAFDKWMKNEEIKFEEPPIQKAMKEILISQPQLPSFVEMLNVSQKNLIKNLWKADDLSISDKINSIDSISKEMPLESRKEYRKWRFLMDRSKMPDFYNSQNEEIKIIIAGMFEKFTDLEKFARAIMSIKSALDHPESFNRWLKYELIELNLVYLLYKNDNGGHEGRIGLFDSQNHSVESITKFQNDYNPYQIATTQNKIFGIRGEDKSFEIYDLNTRQVSRGPDPPEWRWYASVVYYKDKLYYLGGRKPGTWTDTNRVDILINGKWKTGPALPLPTGSVQTITCDGILYVIDGHKSRKIHRLSDNEREWIEVGEIPEIGGYFGVTSLNGRIYITGGYCNGVLKSCLCFDPSAPVDSRISQIADMNYARWFHSLIVANGKLYAIGGFQSSEKRSDGLYYGAEFCNTIEEYDPQTNKWRKVGTLKLE